MDCLVLNIFTKSYIGIQSNEMKRNTIKSIFLPMFHPFYKRNISKKTFLKFILCKHVVTKCQQICSVEWYV